MALPSTDLCVVCGAPYPTAAGDNTIGPRFGPNRAKPRTALFFVSILFSRLFLMQILAFVFFSFEIILDGEDGRLAPVAAATVPQ